MSAPLTPPSAAAGPGSRQLPFWYVTGGCRSGKSAFAQRLAEAAAPRRLYVATCLADPGDEEMAGRIRAHKESRGQGWRVFEPDTAALIDLDAHLPALAVPGEAVLLDCLSLWAAACLRGDCVPDDFAGRCRRLLRSLWDLPCPVYIVGSETGMGLVPPDKAARSFRDMAGLAGQEAAAMARNAVFMVSGLPLALKGDLPD